MSGNGISWAICKSASHSRQTTMPTPHHSVFYTGRMPFLPPNQQRQSTEGISTEGIVGNIQVCSCRMIFVAVSNTAPYLLSDCDCFIKNADCCCIGRCPTLRRWGSQWWLQCRNYQYQLFSQAVMYWFSHRLAQVNSSRNRCSLLFVIITSRNADRQTTRITFTWVILHIFGLF